MDEERRYRSRHWLAVKKELRGGKVAFSELDKILKVIEQAEGQYKDWPMVG
ncbi:MAG: hypothetical protein R2728_00730 [Chitinophagales bacterium]